MTAEQNLDTLKDVSNKIMENMTKATELNMKVMEKFASRQAEATKFMIEQSKRQMELATKIKGVEDIKDFATAQAELAKEASQRLLEESKANMEIATEIREEYSTFIKKEMDDFMDKVRKTTPSGM